ncbi:MAG: LysR family transcriptional regulator substrate-binding protein [Oscillospiraceae bacterium]|nr:LysR family transcriptional regulator substrate-binding protein [Oscillospiraceae bacterium]
MADRSIFTHTHARSLQFPLVSLGVHTQTHAVYSDWFLRHGLRFAPETETAAANQILPLVRHNLGIGFVPAPFLQDSSGVYALTLSEVLPQFSICLLSRNGDISSIAARGFMRSLIKSANMNSDSA